MQRRTRRIALIAGVVVVAAAVWLWPRGHCRSAKSRYGLTLPQCPDGSIRQVVHVHGSGLQRGGEGTVSVTVTAVYTVGKADWAHEADVPSFDVSLSLVDAAGAETPIEPTKRWERPRYRAWTRVVLPDVPDGDYRLRAEVRSRIGAETVDMPLALYAPARVHVMTDRPLYEPGQEVRFRALALRARDLSPIDHRPGTWLVRDPDGEVLLEESAPAGAWGVVAGSFPLDAGATTGAWSVTWQSGADEGTSEFEVRPFTLPRFRVEATPDQSFYRPGQQPVVQGSVMYSSGAPVAGALVDIAWQVQGSWPPPAAWLQGALPERAVTAANGRFALALPEVPDDLQGQVRLIARMSAVDPAGDRVSGAMSLLLSQDAIQVQALTELDGGLVDGANNRIYLRVTLADGRSLPGAAIRVQRAWAAADEGLEAVLDEDGVARIQFDPGPPVNVVIPPMPVRDTSHAPGALVSIARADELISEEPPSLADRQEMDRWLALLAPCARFVGDAPDRVTVALKVSATGALVPAAAGSSALARCVSDALRARRLPAGPERLYALRLVFSEPALPRLHLRVESPLAAPEGLEELLAGAVADARDCLGEDVAEDDGPLPWVLTWQVRARSAAVETSWVRGDDMPPAGVASCVLARVQRQALPAPAAADSLGLVRFAISHPYRAEKAAASQPTIMQGYELLVAAEVAGERVGETRLRMPVGTVPRLRLRAQPVLAAPGEEVTVSLLRGPAFTGELPRMVAVHHQGAVEEIEVDAESRTARFRIPEDGSGWYEALARGERALVYVRAPEDLSVTVTPEAPRYAPGDTARLRVHTRAGTRPVSAAVGLVGVDQSLSELVALPGQDELARVRPPITMSEQAFATLDATALTMGRIRGDNAAEATVLRVTRIPEPAELDAVVHVSVKTSFDPIAELTDRFYGVLSELHAQVRAWEASAPADELMQPAIMARLWEQALDASAARGARIDDAFGRRLRLHRLPADLLALTDPRYVVARGTRLPEDVENWIAWVERTRP